jgi:hypothetical protein
LLETLLELKKLVAPIYSVAGRSSKKQSEIFRSLILMVCLSLPLNKWVDKLLNNPVLQITCGSIGVLPYPVYE